MSGLQTAVKCISVLPSVEPDSSESLRRASKRSTSTTGTDRTGSTEDSRLERCCSSAQLRNSLVNSWTQDDSTEQRALGRCYMDSIASSALVGSLRACILVTCFLVVGAFIAPFGHGHAVHLKNGTGSGILKISSPLLCLNGIFKVIGLRIGGVLSIGNSFECSVGMLSHETTTKFLKYAYWFGRTLRTVFLILMGPPAAILGFFLPSDSPLPHPLVYLAAYSLVALYAWVGCSVTLGMFIPNAWTVKLACDVMDEHLHALVVNDDTEGQQYLQKVLLSLSCIRSLSEGFTENWEFYLLVAEAFLFPIGVIWSISAVQMCQWAASATDVSGLDMMLIFSNVGLALFVWCLIAAIFLHGVLVTSSCDRVVSNARSHLNERMLSRVLMMSGQSTEDANSMSQMFESYVSTCNFGFRPFGFTICPKTALSLFYIFSTVALGIAMNFLL